MSEECESCGGPFEGGYKYSVCADCFVTASFTPSVTVDTDAGIAINTDESGDDECLVIDVLGPPGEPLRGTIRLSAGRATALCHTILGAARNTEGRE